MAILASISWVILLIYQKNGLSWHHPLALVVHGKGNSYRRDQTSVPIYSCQTKVSDLAICRNFKIIYKADGGNDVIFTHAIACCFASETWPRSMFIIFVRIQLQLSDLTVLFILLMQRRLIICNSVGTRLQFSQWRYRPPVPAILWCPSPVFLDGQPGQDQHGKDSRARCSDQLDKGSLAILSGRKSRRNAVYEKRR